MHDISMKEFVEAINALRRQHDTVLAIYKASDRMIDLANYNLGVEDQLVRILARAVEGVDSSVHWSDIDYFCWELDFGRKWKPGMVTDNGRDVRLQTPEDLWCFIMSKNETKEGET